MTKQTAAQTAMNLNRAEELLNSYMDGGATPEQMDAAWAHVRDWKGRITQCSPAMAKQVTDLDACFHGMSNILPWK